MSEEQKELLEHLFNLAESYYTEVTDDKCLKIPDNQGERQFIQEVFMVTGDLLGYLDDEVF